MGCLMLRRKLLDNNIVPNKDNSKVKSDAYLVFHEDFSSVLNLFILILNNIFKISWNHWNPNLYQSIQCCSQ